MTHRLPDKNPAIRVTAMPENTNPAGDIFGGWLMSQMDLAAGSVASRHARGNTVTVAVDGMVFASPVIVGDEVSIYAEIKSVGRTSMKIAVEAWRREHDSDQANMVTQATFTFVKIGRDRKPQPVNQLPVVKEAI
jgi:acyl-CoA thioesterase YciA